jgi:hypothetical protein
VPLLPAPIGVTEASASAVPPPWAPAGELPPIAAAPATLPVPLPLRLAAAVPLLLPGVENPPSPEPLAERAAIAPAAGAAPPTGAIAAPARLPVLPARPPSPIGVSGLAIGPSGARPRVIGASGEAMTLPLPLTLPPPPPPALRLEWFSDGDGIGAPVAPPILTPTGVLEPLAERLALGLLRASSFFFFSLA